MKKSSIPIVLLIFCFVLSSFFSFSIISCEISSEPSVIPKSSSNEEWYIVWGNNTTSETAYEMDIYNETEDIFIVGTQGVSGSEDIILLSYNSSGQKNWVARFDKGDQEFGYGVKVNQSSGDVYVIGTAKIGNYQMCLIKYNTSGVKLWNRTLGSSEHEYGMNVALDSKGYVYIIGVNDTANDDILLIKYAGNGTQIWNRTWDGGAIDWVEDIAIDSNDNIYITGYTTSYGNAKQVILIRYNTSGIQEWNKTYGLSGDEQGLGIDVDSQDNIYISGVQDTYYALLLKYDSSGNFLWMTRKGSAAEGNANGEDVYINSADEICMAVGKSSPGDQLVMYKYSSSAQLLCESKWEREPLLARRSYFVSGHLDDIYIGGYEYNVSSVDWDIIFVKNPDFSCNCDNLTDDDDSGDDIINVYGLPNLIIIPILGTVVILLVLWRKKTRQ